MRLGWAVVSAYTRSVRYVRRTIYAASGAGARTYATGRASFCRNPVTNGYYRRQRREETKVDGCGACRSAMVIGTANVRVVDQRKWMGFIDGENLTIRAQKLAQDESVTLTAGPLFQPDEFVWMPGVRAGTKMGDLQPQIAQIAARMM